MKALLRKLLPIGVGMAIPALLFAAYALHYRSRVQPPMEYSPGKALPGTTLYEEGFHAPSNEWGETTMDEFQMGWVESGEYRMALYEDDSLIRQIAVDLMAPTRLRFSDFQVEVDARQVEGPMAVFGLLIRYQLDHESFYFFQVSDVGYYGVDLIQKDEWTDQAMPEPSAALHQGLEATNHLKVVCRGDHFSFYANDTLLASFTDDTFSSGYVGLAVSTFDKGGAVVHFDNFKVSALNE